MNIRSFFDLSQPVRFREKPAVTETAVAAVSPPAPAAAAAGAGAIEMTMASPAAVPLAVPLSSISVADELTLAWQVVIYLVLVLSIFASRYLDLYRAGVQSEFTVDRAYVLFTAIASLLAFPIVYDRADLNRNRPILVQIGLVFAAGMGWEKIVATAVGK